MKVGDYVRYKYESCIYIGKIKFISEVMSGLDETLQLDIDNCMEEILKEDIIKSSPNIIDLLDIGDYVNGQLVKHIAYFEGVEQPIKKLIFADEYHLIPIEVCEQNEIKSIVTKEQFESMEYKVGEC